MKKNDRPNTHIKHGNDLRDFVGGNILNLIISGLHTDPLSIYREYLQNSADAIAASDAPSTSRVDITVAPDKRHISIRDNGPGLSYSKAKQRLIPISSSTKRVGQNRGFRGIGRLAGLAFGKSVTFLTRCNENLLVTKVCWNGEQLKSATNQKLSAEDTIQRCVTIEKINDNNYPAHFFEVQIEDISRYAASSILNTNAVHKYVGQICPVPFDKDFIYGLNIKNTLKNTEFLTLNIYLNDSEIPITRPHENELYCSQNRIDQFAEFEKIQIPEIDNDNCAAIGWVAHSSYLGALPDKLGIRGLRARIGNIQIGDENLFNHLFTESRFNLWCVGEIHIVSPYIIPNAKRDYFESNPHLRNLENRLGSICHKLEQKCRTLSRERNQEKRVQSFIDDIKATLKIIEANYFSKIVTQQLINEQIVKIDNFINKNQSCCDSKMLSKINRIKNRLTNFRVDQSTSPFQKLSQSKLAAYKAVFKIIVETSPPQVAQKTIQTIMKETLKKPS